MPICCCRGVCSDTAGSQFLDVDEIVPAYQVMMLAPLREADERSLVVKDIDCLAADKAG